MAAKPRIPGIVTQKSLVVKTIFTWQFRQSVAWHIITHQPLRKGLITEPVGTLLILLPLAFSNVLNCHQ